MVDLAPTDYMFGTLARGDPPSNAQATRTSSVGHSARRGWRSGCPRGATRAASGSTTGGAA